MLAHQDTISSGELLAPRTPSESLTPIADALFPLPAWDFAALSKLEAYTRRLRRFAMRWRAARKRLQRTLLASPVAIEVLAPIDPALRVMLDGLAVMIAKDLLRRQGWIVADGGSVC